MQNGILLYWSQSHMTLLRCLVTRGLFCISGYTVSQNSWLGRGKAGIYLWAPRHILLFTSPTLSHGTLVLFTSGMCTQPL
jgi:hypothetical protein